MIAFDDTAEPREQPRSHHMVDCAGARLSAHVTRVATVLDVAGEVDASNAELLAQAIRRVSRLKGPLILDLRQLDFLGLAGFRALMALNHEHQEALLHCSVIAGTELRRLTRIYPDHGLPIVDSVPEALQLIDTINQSRRRFLSDLVQQPQPQRRRFSVRIVGVGS